MVDFKKLFPDYDVDTNGVVYKMNQELHPFKSNKYLQVVMFDADRRKRVMGVHTVVAMKYLDYYTGCIVHHLDENTQNNQLYNLQILSKSEHSKLHYATNNAFKNKSGVHGGWNKGQKMSTEFCRHVSESAKRSRNKSKLNQCGDIV